MWARNLAHSSCKIISLPLFTLGWICWTSYLFRSAASNKEVLQNSNTWKETAATPRQLHL